METASHRPPVRWKGVSRKLKTHPGAFSSFLKFLQRSGCVGNCFKFKKDAAAWHLPRPKINYLRHFSGTRCSMIARDDHQRCSHTVPPPSRGIGNSQANTSTFHIRFASSLRNSSSLLTTPPTRTAGGVAHLPPVARNPNLNFQ